MSVRSKFERQLSPGLRSIGFSIKIPDAGKSHKPFDYVVGIPVVTSGQFGQHTATLRFVAIEAKKADGWAVSQSKWQPHQRSALDALDRLCSNSSWVAVGFLDAPQMKRDWDGKKIVSKIKKSAVILPWYIYKSMECSNAGSFRYNHVADKPDYFLDWVKSNSGYYHWNVPFGHSLISQQK